jgi:2-oxoglutarate ferredoxin oxidoreductase subunit alpha
MDLNIRIGGEAGQGIVSIGEILSNAWVRGGLHVFTGQSYMSRIRGGLNWADLRISNEELFGLRENADLLVAFSSSAYEILKADLSENGKVIYNCSEKEEVDHDGVICFDFKQIAKEAGGTAVMTNAVAAGAVMAMLDDDLENLLDYLEQEFEDKGEELVEKNKKCAQAGFDQVSKKKVSLSSPEKSGSPSGVLVKGAEAIGLGAAVSGVKFVTAYPMSPSTATFASLAQKADRYGIVVEQAEDEIAAINMVCGAAYTGVMAMTTTSGGGFALMGEGVSLAGIMELPAVVLIAQRPGPATGLPTRTGQEDLNLAIYSGHGEFARAVYAPGSQKQCYDLTRHAIATAQRFQTPVILLTEQYLQDATKNIGEPLSDDFDPVDRHLVEATDENYRRYEITDDGISPRAVPGGKATVISDSDEHGEDGHITEDLETRIRMQKKRLDKIESLKGDFLEPEYYGPQEAETLLLCWGATYGAVREAVDRLNRQEEKVAMLHFAQVWPLVPEKIRPQLEKPQRVVMIEGNSTAQFRTLLHSQGCCRKMDTLLRYDGLPITADYIMKEVNA